MGCKCIDELILCIYQYSAIIIFQIDGFTAQIIQYQSECQKQIEKLKLEIIKIKNQQQLNTSTNNGYKDFTFANNKMMSALNVEKVVIGLENVLIEHHHKEGEDILIQDQDTEDQEDLIQDHVHILLIHLLIPEREEMIRREVDTTEEVEVQEEITRERKVPVAEDQKAIQGPDHQSAINNASHTSHLHLNEKGSKKKRNQKLNQILFSHFQFSLFISGLNHVIFVKCSLKLQVLKQQIKQTKFHINIYIFK